MLARDKVLCKLTGALINRNEDAIWKHMLGKKFQKALGMARGDCLCIPFFQSQIFPDRFSKGGREKKHQEIEEEGYD